MIEETLHFKRVWKIRRYAGEQDFQDGRASEVIDPVTGDKLPAESVIEGNLLLNEGIALLEDLLIGAGGTNFGNANSYLGVGDSSTAAAASQTGLQASTNKLYKAMESGYPQRSGQTLTWRSIFGANDANFPWNEFSAANGNSDAAVNLNRRVDGQGTKASGQIWTLDLALTLS